MKQQYTVEISDSVYWVGIRDWNRRLFDALVPLPQGTTYNAYLVAGKEKTALVDTVNPGFHDELLEKINSIRPVSDIDYLIMNHAEPDHASAIPAIMKANGKALLVATAKGAKMATTYFKVPAERIKLVKEGDSIDLGGKTLEFIDAPWLHWPETMFTWIPEDRILFPCDYFGAHTAFSLYAEENGELASLAKRYFGEIMMPFRKQGAQALEKVKGLDVKMIAPSHGPIYRDPQKILGHYAKWTAGETTEKALLAYVSMWGSTDLMMKALADRLLENGIKVCLYDLTHSDVGDIARELVDSRAIVLGSPTVIGGLHPLAIYAANLVRILKPPARFAAFVGSYGWGGGALRQVQELLGPTRMEIVGAIDINGPPGDADLKTIGDLADQLTARIRQGQ